MTRLRDAVALGCHPERSEGSQYRPNLPRHSTGISTDEPTRSYQGYYDDRSCLHRHLRRPQTARRASPEPASQQRSPGVRGIAVQLRAGKNGEESLHRRLIRQRSRPRHLERPRGSRRLPSLGPAPRPGNRRYDRTFFSRVRIRSGIGCRVPVSASKIRPRHSHLGKSADSNSRVKII